KIQVTVKPAEHPPSHEQLPGEIELLQILARVELKGEKRARKRKSKAAQTLASGRATAGEKQKAAAALSAKRWGKTTAEERTDYARRIAQQPRPSRMNPDRCPCGIMTAERARKRAHICQPKTEA